MASIHTRGKKHYVVVSVKNAELGTFESQWIPCDNAEEAATLKKKLDAEQKQAKKDKKKNAVTNATRTVDQLAQQYIRLVGKEKWGVSTYRDYIARYDNYIKPHIGNMRVWDCTTLAMDEYFAKLKDSFAVRQAGKAIKPISAKVMNEIHKFLKAMFYQAIEWNMIDKNPCRKRNSTLPECVKGKRAFWTRNEFMHACSCAEKIDDLMLLVAMHLSVGTTMREGEICGLQWERCYLSEKDIASGDCRIVIDRELSRVPKYSMQELNNKGIMYVFPNLLGDAKSSMVLKDPKSKTSNRTIWLPPTVARLMLKLKEQQERNKEWYGDSYRDYDLVVCWDDGRPFEGRQFNKRLKKLIAQFDLPPVVFHSIRHTSTTYKLKIAGGDVKLVQGDTGHANSQMVTDVYAEIVDEDRKYNAQRFEQEFYGSPLEASTPAAPAPQQQATVSPQDLAALVSLLQNNPNAVASLLQNTGIQTAV